MAYERSMTAWVDILTQRVATLVRLKGELWREQTDETIVELLRDLAIERKRIARDHEKRGSAFRRIRWVRTEIAALRKFRARQWPEVRRAA